MLKFKVKDFLFRQFDALSAKAIQNPTKSAWAVLSLWVLFSLINAKLFIFHDGFRHIFPVTFAVAKQGKWFGLPHWLGSVDSGSPLLIYVMSFSLTSPFRILAINLMTLFHMEVKQAIYFQKFEILFTYFSFCFGMYVLGRILFKRHFSAVYLFATSLFFGLCMEGIHSDQGFSEILYLPWIAACVALFHRNRESSKAIWYATGAVLFLSLEAEDLYPHFPILMAGAASVIYLLCWPRSIKVFLKKENIIKCLPLLFILVVTAFQFLLIKNAMADYTSMLRQRGQMKIQFWEETYFIQPLALLGTFWPNGLFGGFTEFEAASRSVLTNQLHILNRAMFIFEKDQFMMGVGIIPLLFNLIFLLRPGMRRVRIFWGLFTLFFILTCSQDSHFYQMLYHLPFFDVFRVYGWFLVFALFGILVMSGYGMDAYLTLNPNIRSRIFKKSARIILGGVIVSGIILAFLVFHMRASLNSAEATELFWDFILDLTLSTTAIALFWKCGGTKIKARTGAVLLTSIFCISQIFYFQNIFHRFGETRKQIYSQMGILDQKHYIEDEAPRELIPHRGLCPVSFALCYVASVDMMSWWEGSFLRNYDEPLFRYIPDRWPHWGPEGSPYKIKLTTNSFSALAAVTHPEYWLSSQVLPLNNPDKIVTTLNESNNPGAFLDRYVFVEPQVYAKLNNDMSKISIGMKGNEVEDSSQTKITAFTRKVDGAYLEYSSRKPTFLNASIQYTPDWKIRVDGTLVPVYKGNFNSLVAKVPAGNRKVEISYESLKTDLFFYFRYLFLVVGLFIVIHIIRITKNETDTLLRGRDIEI